MVHKLVLVAAIGLATSAACIGTAAAIGGIDLNEGGDGFSLFDGRPRCEPVAKPGTGTRIMEWDGSDAVHVNLSGLATYTPGEGEQLTASGDPQVLAHLRIKRGQLEMDCRGWKDRTRTVNVTLPGRRFDKFSISSGRMVLSNLDQSRVKIEIAGSGKMKAAGKFEDAKFTIAGSGEMDLDDVTAQRSRMEIAGSGTLRAGRVSADDLRMSIAGSGHAEFGQLTARSAKAEIAGSGTVIARGNADDLKIEIAGSGRADFGRLVSRTAKVEIGGHGDVDIAATDVADVEIGGSGDVTLHGEPKHLETDIGGSGRIHRAAAGS